MLQAQGVSASPSPAWQVASPAWPHALRGCQTPPETPFCLHLSHCSSPPSFFAPDLLQTFRPHCCEVLGLTPVTGVPSQTRAPRAVRGWGRKTGGLPGGVQSQLSSFSSVAQLCPTLCNPMNCSTPGFPVHHELPDRAQTHAQQLSY